MSEHGCDIKNLNKLGIMIVNEIIVHHSADGPMITIFTQHYFTRNYSKLFTDTILNIGLLLAH